MESWSHRATEPPSHRKSPESQRVDTNFARLELRNSRPRFTDHRGGRVVVVHEGADSIRKVNRTLPPIDDLPRATNRNAVASPKVTDMVSVCDLETESFHVILIHRLDFRPRLAPAVGRVAVFSKPAFAPCRTEALQLATPGYYRKNESLEPGIRDRRDGTLTKDGSVWASKIVGGAVTARLSFVSEREPWVYCASHYHTDSELRRLRNEFDASYGYSAASRISDADDFAACLGVDFALGLDKTTEVTLGPFEARGYAGSSYTTSLWEGRRHIDTIVHIYHGPVNYEDLSGTVRSDEGWFDPNAAPLAWFTKRTSFSHQSEYRFAVTTLGSPKSQKHCIAVSRELRSLTSPL